MNKAVYILGIFAGILVNSTAQAADTGQVSVEDAWIREAPPTAMVLAGYMSIRNKSDQAHTVTKVASPDFAAVEIHGTVMAAGVARMVHKERLELPPRSTLRLEPGGLHLMLMQPNKPLLSGDDVTLELELDDGSRIVATVPVRRP